MASLRFPSSLWITALLAAGILPAAAQDAVKQVPAGQSDVKVHPVPPAGELRSTAVPWRAVAVPSETPADKEPVRFRAEEQMTAADRALLASQGHAIATAAEFHSIDPATGAWTRSQIECPALPGHLFVRYSRNQGPGDVTVFTAAIARGGEAKVHVIPVLRRSYATLFESPGNVAALGIFNRVLREEGSAGPRSWYGLGLCYVALAGAGPGPAQADAATRTLDAEAILSVVDGKTVLHVADSNVLTRTAEWTLVFDRNGMLLEAGRSRNDGVDAHAVPRGGALVSHAVPKGEAPETHAVPQGPAPVAHPVPQK
jgi:hypothetical protein